MGDYSGRRRGGAGNSCLVLAVAILVGLPAIVATAAHLL
jgi:hypothetical protein